MADKSPSRRLLGCSFTEEHPMNGKRPNEPIGANTIPGEPTDPKIPPADETDSDPEVTPLDEDNNIEDGIEVDER
jgi:hypothetical protein